MGYCLWYFRQAYKIIRKKTRRIRAINGTGRHAYLMKNSEVN